MLSGGTGAYLEGTARVQIPINVNFSKEEREQRKQKWVALVRIWTKQGANPSDALNNALAHFGEETSWNSLYNVYETIQVDYNYSQGVTNKRNFKSLPEQ